MFRRRSISKGLIAFLIPLTFVWSWAACSLLCGEITELHEKQSSTLFGQAGENCLTAFDSDSCPMRTNAAIIEGRQTIVAPALNDQKIVSLQLPEFLFRTAFIYPADAHQNSPPSVSSAPPLFVRHCNFRI
jgi:hypothetical protein